MNSRLRSQTSCQTESIVSEWPRAVGAAGVDLELGARIEVGDGGLEERLARRGDVEALVEIPRLGLADGVAQL
jgi:hypothetical protein